MLIENHRTWHISIYSSPLLWFCLFFLAVVDFAADVPVVVFVAAFSNVKRQKHLLTNDEVDVAVVYTMSRHAVVVPSLNTLLSISIHYSFEYPLVLRIYIISSCCHVNILM